MEMRRGEDKGGGEREERGEEVHTQGREARKGRGSIVTHILCMTSNVNTVEYVSSAHCTIHAKLLHRVEK